MTPIRHIVPKRATYDALERAGELGLRAIRDFLHV